MMIHMSQTSPCQNSAGQMGKTGKIILVSVFAFGALGIAYVITRAPVNDAGNPASKYGELYDAWGTWCKVKKIWN